MATSLRGKGSKLELKDKNKNLKQLTLMQAPSAAADASTGDPGSKVLAELEKLRKENLDGHTQTRLSLTKL